MHSEFHSEPHRKRHRAGSALALLLFCATAARALPARADVYLWVEEDGSVYYSVDAQTPAGSAEKRIPPLGLESRTQSGAVPAGGLRPPITGSDETLAGWSDLDERRDLLPDSFRLALALGRPVAAVAASPSETIAELERRIAEDRERLKELISRARGPDADLAANPKVREIGERLRRLRAQLAAVRAGQP